MSRYATTEQQQMRQSDSFTAAPLLLSLVFLTISPCLAWAASLNDSSLSFAPSSDTQLGFAYVRQEGSFQLSTRTPTLEAYGISMRMQLGGDPASFWTGGVYYSRSLRATLDTGGLPLFIDATRLPLPVFSRTNPWLAMTSGTGSAKLFSGGEDRRRLISSDHLIYQRLNCQAGKLRLSGLYQDVGLAFNGATALAGQLPEGLDASAVDASRGSSKLNFAAALPISDQAALTSSLSRTNALKPDAPNVTTTTTEINHQLALQMGADTDVKLSYQSQNTSQNKAKAAKSGTVTKTVALAHRFGDEGQLSLSRQLTDARTGKSRENRDTTSLDFGWKFAPGRAFALKLADTRYGDSRHDRRFDFDLGWQLSKRLGFATSYRSSRLRTGAIEQGSSYALTGDLGSKAHPLKFSLQRQGKASSQKGLLDSTVLKVESSSPRRPLKFSASRVSSGRTVRSFETTTTGFQLDTKLNLFGRSASLQGNWQDTLEGIATRSTATSLRNLVLTAEFLPGTNLVAELYRRDQDKRGSLLSSDRQRLSLSRQMGKRSHLVAAVEQIAGGSPSNQTTRHNLEYKTQLRGYSLALGQQQVGQCSQPVVPTTYLSFSTPGRAVPAWASTAGAAFFGNDANYRFASLPALTALTGKTGLSFRYTLRQPPGGKQVPVEGISYITRLGGNFVLRYSVDGWPQDEQGNYLPVRRSLWEISSRFGKLNWLVRRTGDQWYNGKGQAESTVFGLRGALSAREQLALTVVSRQELGRQAPALGLAAEYSRKVSDQHYLLIRGQWSERARASGSDYRVEVGYRKAI